MRRILIRPLQPLLKDAPLSNAALLLLFSLVVSGQIKLRRRDGWRKIAAVLSQRSAVAA